MAKQSGEVSVSKAEDRNGQMPAMFGWHEPLMGLRGEIDRMFENVMKGWPGFGELDMMKGAAGSPAKMAPALMPSVEVSEDEKAYQISVELPGMDEQDVELTLRDDRLVLQGEKKAEHEEKKKDYHVRERSFGSFQRAFRLPDDVDAGKIVAKMKQGVMTVSLPKTPEAAKKQRKIAISAR